MTKPMTTSQYPVIVCADDYALSPAIDEAIVQLLQSGQLSATSCMTLSPRWPEAAKALHALRADAEFGLHLDLTEFSPICRHQQALLVARCWLRWLPLQAIRERIIQQLDAFEAEMGVPPDYVDGHLHVHQLPVIRDVLLNILATRYATTARPWIRVSRPPRKAGLKASVIRWLGANQLEIGAKRLGFNVSPLLLGVYDFLPDQPHYFACWRVWLAHLRDYYKTNANGTLHVPPVLMCHPAVLIDSERDAIRLARVEEWQCMRSNTFVEWFQTSGMQVVRGKDYV